MVKVACVMMQRNEDVCLEPWLKYHGHLFGFENLFVIDHGSDNAAVIGTLDAYALRGVQVHGLPAAADYRRKGDFLGELLHEVDEERLHDFLIPLDCDEFVAMREADGRPTCGRTALLAYLATLAAQTAPLLVAENFLNMLGHPATFWALPYQKVFFTRGHGGTLDHGSHTSPSRAATPMAATRLAYLHFHHKSYARQQAAAREKLRGFVDVTDAAALREFRGTGWHLVTHLMKTREEYLAIMTPDARCVTFPEIVETLLSLGIDPRFADV